MKKLRLKKVKVMKNKNKKDMKKRVIKKNSKKTMKKIIHKKVHHRKKLNKKLNKKAGRKIRQKIHHRKKSDKKFHEKTRRKNRREVHKHISRKIKTQRHRIKNLVNEKDKTLKKTSIPIVMPEEEKLPRAGIGIKEYDKLIEGGFERNSINLIVGGSGSGKSIFAIQFLMEGVSKGEPGLYVSFEEKKDEFFKNMKKFGWDLYKLEKTGKFIFLEYSPEKVKMTLDEGGGTIESLILRHKIKRMVIDSVTSFSLLFDDPLSKKQANLGLFDIISKWKTTTLLTVQHDPSKEREDDLATIEFEADSITLLYFIEVKSKRQRFVEILKMRGTDHSKDTFEFEIKKGGIKLGRKIDLKSYLR